jgi:hypothetical protein
MTKMNCEVIRRELDELMLNDACSDSAVAHLKECSACREFHEQQTKLRQIVGSLGTVAAPADFDFRLRARLATDSSSAAFHLKTTYWPFARRGFAVATLLLVFAAGVVVVRNIMNRPATGDVAAGIEVQPKPSAPVINETPAPVINTVDYLASSPSNGSKIKNERTPQTGPKSKRQLATVDFSSERADLINGSEASTAKAFPIEASMQSFKVSLDDGRGNARTISVPTISFGSQRMPNSNQYAPKNVW